MIKSGGAAHRPVFDRAFRPHRAECLRVTMSASDSPNEGRLLREHEDPYARDAAPLAVDRERIVHSSAFRRLQYKTQVFVILEDDHFRTRLTHTLEVAHLAGRIAERLARTGTAVDPLLAEVVALGHDLGHPPFGHAGERALDECLQSHTGGRERFEHNAHSLRVVEYLEHPYPDFRGLNLTRVVRECMAKHTTQFDRPGAHPLQDGRPPPLEGRVAALADRLAYTLHDLQDGLYSGLISPGELGEITLWREAYDGPDPDADQAWRGWLRPAVERIQSALIDDAVGALSAAEAGSAGVSESAGIMGSAGVSPASEMSTEMEREFGALSGLLVQRLYRNPRLVRMDSKARRVLREVYEAYVREPALLPPRFARRVESQGAARVAADYVAGMTDRFCVQEHGRLFDPKMDV